MRRTEEQIRADKAEAVEAVKRCTSALNDALDRVTIYEVEASVVPAINPMRKSPQVIVELYERL